MANYMKRVVIPTYRNYRYEYDESLVYVDSELTSDPIIMPGGDNKLTVTLAITAGEGKIQTTNNKVEDVLSDTDVEWVDWDNGSVTVTTQDKAVGSVTALRFICTSGTVRLLMTAQ